MRGSVPGGQGDLSKPSFSYFATAVRLVAVLFLLLPFHALADIPGVVSVIDVDTIEFHGQRTDHSEYWRRLDSQSN